MADKTKPEDPIAEEAGSRRGGPFRLPETAQEAEDMGFAQPGPYRRPEDVKFRSTEVAVTLSRRDTPVDAEALILAATDVLANQLFTSWMNERRAVTASFSLRLEEY